MTSVEQVLDAHRPRNMAHHIGRYANLADTYSTVQCECQEPNAPFMTQEAYTMHLVVALTALSPGTVIDEIDERTILIKTHRDARMQGVWVRAAEPRPSPADEQMRRLVEADQYELHPTEGRVPRGVCRCPILKVGDFCPVHGG